jgi:hypothetical protein
MKQIGSLRWIGLLILVGTVIFSAATIIAEPFEQETPQALYAAVAANPATYRTVNILATIGLALLLLGFFRLAALIQSTSRSLYIACLVLLSVAFIFWMIEASVRLTKVAADSQAAAGGSNPTGGAGIGFDLFFLGFFIAALVGTALLMWGLGRAGALSARIAMLASAVVLVSGIVAAIFYPWVGGVERVFFYPLFIVVLPLAIFLLVRRRQPAAIPAG